MKSIRLLRATKNMSQQDLADAIGVSRNTIINIENDGQRSVTPDMEDKLCGVFGVSRCVLYGSDNIRHMPRTRDEADQLIRIIEREVG